MNENDGSIVKAANGVFYTHASDPGLVRYRTTKRHHALYDTYSASPAPDRQLDFNLELGSEYVNGANSYLRFTFSCDSPGAGVLNIASLSSGWTDIVQELLIIDRNGVTIERIENAHLIASQRATMTYVDDQLHHATQAFPADRDIITGITYDVVIPLHFLCGVFATERLLPPQIFSGATVRLTLRDANMALHTISPLLPDYASAAGWTYTITNPMLVCESYVFDNRLHDMITEEYASTGLVFPFVSYTSQTLPLSVEQVTLSHQIRLPFTRAIKLFISTAIAFGDYRDAYVDNDKPDRATIAAFSWRAFQAQIGDNRFPNYVLDSANEAWQLAVSTMNKSMSHGMASTARGDFDAGERLLINLDRGVGGVSSGVVINNNYPLILNFTLAAERIVDSENLAFDDVVPPRALQMFIEHQRIIAAGGGVTTVAV